MSKTDSEFVETSPIRRASRATFPLRGKVDAVPYAIALPQRGKVKSKSIGDRRPQGSLYMRRSVYGRFAHTSIFIGGSAARITTAIPPPDRHTLANKSED